MVAVHCVQSQKNQNTEECVSDNLVTLCKKCEPAIVQIRGNKNSTTNFLTHLKRKHGDRALQEYYEYKTKKSQGGINQRKTALRRNTTVNLKQNDFEELISRFIVSSMVPFRVVEDEWFVEIFKQLKIDRHGLKVPSRRAVIRDIEKNCRRFKNSTNITNNGSNFVKAFRKFGVNKNLIEMSKKMNVFPDEEKQHENEDDSSSDSENCEK
ncbi:hypothetical protein ABEB36_010811 [Hypothenemus hampei]|uniref:BED-type domain-containing protein n=1 Tax=Hypothenemus hampei TaxID=57062 RepID=A0ABD1EDV1_HYPHA